LRYDLSNGLAGIVGDQFVELHESDIGQDKRVAQACTDEEADDEVGGGELEFGDEEDGKESGQNIQ
jgi:hypothetical protein